MSSERASGDVLTDSFKVADQLERHSIANYRCQSSPHSTSAPLGPLSPTIVQLESLRTRGHIRRGCISGRTESRTDKIVPGRMVAHTYWKRQTYQGPSIAGVQDLLLMESKLLMIDISTFYLYAILQNMPRLPTRLQYTYFNALMISIANSVSLLASPTLVRTSFPDVIHSYNSLNSKV